MLIQEMRKRSQGIVAKIIVGMIIVVFALFGFGSITTFLVPVPKVASVNGDDIEESEMLFAVERRRRIMMANSQNPDVDDDQLRTAVLEELVERKLLSQLSDDYGMYYSEGKIDRDIISTEAFLVDGQFDPQQFQLAIRSIGYTPIGYRDLIREESRYRQITLGLAGTEFVTAEEVDRLAALSRQKRDVAYMILTGDRIAAQNSLDDQALIDYYDAHPDEFITPETVKLEFIELLKEQIAFDINYEESDLLAYFEEEKINYTKPEERRAAHILIEINDEVDEQSAKQKIDEVYRRIIDGEDFAALAEEVSDDTGSAEQGGDLGFSAKGAFVPEFEATLMSLQPNQMSEPVLTEFGYHLIKLLEVQPERVPAFDEIKEKLAEEYQYGLR